MRTSTVITRLGTFSVLAGVAALLTGCTASVNLTVAAEDVATVGAKALSTQWDTAATMDCGNGSVDSIEGTEVECTAFNPKSGLDYPATVTLKKIDGTNYTVSVVTAAHSDLPRRHDRLRRHRRRRCAARGERRRDRRDRDRLQHRRGHDGSPARIAGRRRTVSNASLLSGVLLTARRGVAGAQGRPGVLA